MAEYLIKRTIFLTPKSRIEGSKALEPIPNRIVLKKGEKFEGTIKPSTDPNVESILAFSYNGYEFEKPYGGTDPYARMNKNDLALVGTPEAVLSVPLGNSNVQGGNYKPFDPTKFGYDPNRNESTSKSTSGTSIFQFKDKLHAGVTLVGVAFGVYYAYKTKGSIGKYIGYALGAGAVGFILGSVASSFAMQTPVKQKKEEGNVPEGAKPAFTGTISPNMDRKGGKLDTSVEGGTMETQMNSIL
jgi:hypothetical protein